MFSLHGKTAVVTGGSSGIGRAIAERFAAQGARVLIADRSVPDWLDSEQNQLIHFCRTDVSREVELAAAVAQARETWDSVDVLVNNAGIQPLGVPLDGITEALLSRTFQVNVHAVAFGLKTAAKALNEGGRVINLASFVGSIATPNAAIYATSKAAVIHLTRLGAIELAPRRITVNAISPGTIRTPAVTSIVDNPEIAFIEARTPLGRLGEPEEVAALCHFLASNEASYITGQNIGIDGGLTAGWTEYDLVAPANVRNGAWNDDV